MINRESELEQPSTLVMYTKEITKHGANLVEIYNEWRL